MSDPIQQRVRTAVSAALDKKAFDMVVLGVPNQVHCQVTVDAAAAGKHIVLEKPMCLNLSEADQMLAACRKAKVKLVSAGMPAPYCARTNTHGRTR